MRHHRPILLLGVFSIAIWVLGPSLVWAEPVTFTVAGSENITLTAPTAGGPASDTETSAIAGTFSADLTWDGTQVTGIQFIPVTIPVPNPTKVSGNISFTDVTFPWQKVGDTYNAVGMMGDFTTPGSGFVPVSSGSFLHGRYQNHSQRRDAFRSYRYGIHCRSQH